MNKNNVTIKFWGVRGSYPTPGSNTVHFGGNTSSIEIRMGDRTIILDAGTGIIPLGRDLVRRSVKAGKNIDATLLFSHMHHDHTQGFPFFVPAFILSTRLHIFGPHTFERDLEQILAHNMIPPFFPVTLQDMGATKNIHSLSENQVLLIGEADQEPRVIPANSSECSQGGDAICVRVLRSYAHPGGVLIYRIEWRDRAIVYATDTEGYDNTDRRLVEFAHDADLLIHDAQYTEEHYLGLTPGVRSTQGWGHSTTTMACDVARSAGARRLALFHYDPGYADSSLEKIEASARRLFKGAFAAREGMEIALDDNPVVLPRISSRAYAWSQPAMQP